MVDNKELSPADKAKQEAQQKAAAEAEAKAKAAAEAKAKEAEDAKLAELKKLADAEAERIAASDEGANTDDDYTDGRSQNSKSDKRALAEAALGKLRNIALDFQRSTPDEHIIFGRAGVVFTLGDLRDLTNVRD